jgi:hypothetical protein
MKPLGPNSWTAARIARLGYLVGLGWSSKDIARDPLISAEPNNVYRQVHRFGLSFRAAAVACSVAPEGSAEALDAAAVKRGLTPEQLIMRLLAEMDSTLIDNILDDEFSRQAA